MVVMPSYAVRRLARYWPWGGTHDHPEPGALNQPAKEPPTSRVIAKIILKPGKQYHTRVIGRKVMHIIETDERL